MPASAPPYEGLRVIELAEDPAGEILGKLMAEQGADVVKVEPPAGAPSRRIGPFHDDIADVDRSLTFWYYNTNKRSVVLDLDSSLADRDLFRGLAASADILIEDFRPGTLGKLGLDYEVVKERNPRLVYAAISGFGQTGPYSARGGSI